MSGVFTYTKTRKMHWTFIILWLMSQRGWSSFFAKTFNSWKPLIISAKRSILDVWEKLLNKPLCCEERSSRQDVFCKKSVLRNFAKFTGKHLCQSLYLNKVSGLWPETLLKQRLWRRCFPVNFGKFLRTPFLTEHLRWLLQWRVSSYSILLFAWRNSGYSR